MAGFFGRFVAVALTSDGQPGYGPASGTYSGRSDTAKPSWSCSSRNQILYRSTLSGRVERLCDGAESELEAEGVRDL